MKSSDDRVERLTSSTNMNMAFEISIRLLWALQLGEISMGSNELRNARIDEII